MQTRNPILRRAGKEYAQEGYSTGYSGGPGQAPPPASAQLAARYGQPGPVGASGAVMTLNDVIVKSGILFGVLLVGAVIGWPLGPIALMAALVAFVLAMVATFKRKVSPALIIFYAFFEGIFLGGISAVFQSYGQASGYGNLVLTAVVATLVVVAVMLALYTTRVIKVTARFQRILMVALIGYVGFALVSLVASLFGVGNGFGFFGMGIIGIILSVFVVVLAAFTLCMDFEMISQYVRAGVPENESWRMGFALMVTIVWLYLEILRLLAIVSSNR